jgi:hypothetical protein
VHREFSPRQPDRSTAAARIETQLSAGVLDGALEAAQVGAVAPVASPVPGDVLPGQRGAR